MKQSNRALSPLLLLGIKQTCGVSFYDWMQVIYLHIANLFFSYNVTNYSEKFELLALRFGERFVGAETDTSVNIHSGGMQSPSSASKRKALRLKYVYFFF